MRFEDIKRRMVQGTGASSLIYGGGENSYSHHYIDSLQRFQKDFATSEKKRRQQQQRRKTSEIERRRQRTLDRQDKYYKVMDQQYSHQAELRERLINEQLMRVRRRANVSSLPYNPINLQYDPTVPGYNLKRQDQDHQIRNLVRAHNMDTKGNGKYNPLTGQFRGGVEKLVPSQLQSRFDVRLQQHYDGYKIKLPQYPYKKRSTTS